MRAEPVWKGHETIEQVDEHLATDAGLDIGSLPLAAADVKGPDTADIALVDVVFALGDRQIGRELRLLLLHDRLRLIGGDLSELEQPLEIALMYARPPLDHPVQGRLCEGRLVGLIVAAAPEAIHVDDNIPLKLTAEVHRQADHLGHGLRVLSVDMKDRDLKHLRHVCGVGAGA